MKARRWRGLYVLTDPILCAGRLLPLTEAALRGGARMVQYRDKSDDKTKRLAETRALRALCRQYEVPLIINDDVALAHAVGAAGVHLGRDDATIDAARAALGKQAIIGVSCYNELQRAIQAAQAGADYLAFGRYYTSATKPDAVDAGCELLQEARRQLNLPLVAIGGITPENGAPLVAAGADLLAVVQGVFAQPDPESAARRYTALFA